MKNTSKLLSLLLCVCLLLSALPLAAVAQDPGANDFSFFYDVIDQEQKFIVVFGLDGPVTGGVLTVPSKINGYTVKEIGWNAFRDRHGLKEVVLPDTVAYIGGSAFENCDNLKTVKLPAELQEIDSACFARCASLEEIELPEGVRRVADRVFEECENLKTVKLPASLERIQSSAFFNCAALEEIDLPEHLIELGDYAFESCRSLKEIALPSGLEYVSEGAFYECASLETVTLPEGLRDIGPYAFQGCAALTGLNLPASFRGMSEFAFADCASLTTVHIPAEVEYINTDAFVNCQAMTALTVDPENRRFTADDGILYNKDMGALLIYPTGRPGESFRLSDSVHSVEGSWAFTGTALKSLDINQADHIALGAISTSDISQLTKAADNDRFIIENNVLYNDNGEFLLAYPGGLTAETFTVPERVWNIEANAFRNNRHLKKVVLPEGVTQIMDRAFQNSTVEEVNIPASVTLLDEAVFIDCADLKAVAVPEGIISLPYATFAGCLSLKSVTLPESLVEIGDFAFAECENLQMPALPGGLTRIGYRAFQRCRQMKTLSLPASVNYIDFGAFESTPWFDGLPDGPVYLNNVLYAYKGEVPENTSFTVKEGTVMITAEAFGWQWGLAQLTVPDSVEIVGRDAFTDTRWFNETIPEGDVYIGRAYYAHKGPYEEKTMTLKEGTVTVTPGAFWELRNIETLSIPASLKELRDWDMFDLHNLKAFTVAEDNETFASADGVLYTKDGVRLLCYPPCKEDKAYEVPYGVVNIAWHAFRDNEHLETLTVHNTLRDCYEAMVNIPALKDVYYGGVRRTWDETSDSYNLLQNNAQLHCTHEDVFKETDPFIVVAVGARVGDVMFPLSEGAGLPVFRPGNGPVTPEDDVCSGMEITLRDNKKATLVILGDVDGDSQITSADARLALRYSVKLDDPDRWQLAASKVCGEEEVSSSDARLILRGSVGLEDPMDWYRAG